MKGRYRWLWFCDKESMALDNLDGTELLHWDSCGILCFFMCPSIGIREVDVQVFGSRIGTTI